MGNTRDTGYLRNIIAYDASGNVGIGGAVNASYKVTINGTSIHTGASVFSAFVGINGSPGTAFPLEAYINSSTAYSSSSRGNVMRVYNSNGSANVFAGIELGGAGTANDGLAGINGVVTGSGSAALTMYTRNDGTFSEKLRVTSAGNVGIGTSNPALTTATRTTLDIGNASESLLVLSTGGSWRSYFYNDGTNLSIANSGGFINFDVLGERMRITNAGRVGINTSTPQRTLDVRGAVNLGTTAASVSSTSGAYADIHLRTWDGATSSPSRITVVDNWMDYVATFTDGHRFRNYSSNGVIRDLMTITGGGSVQIANGYLSVSAGSGVGYSSIMQTGYNFPYIDTYIDSVAGPSYQGRIRLRTNAENGGFGDRMIIYHSGAINIPFLAGGGTRTVTALSDGTLSTSSDSRLKQEDLNYHIEGLSEILKVKPRAYKWLSDIQQRGSDATTEVGFFADEVAPVIPSAAPMGNDNYYGFYDRAITAVLVKSIQEEDAKVEDLKAEVAQLKERIAYLENK